MKTTYFQIGFIKMLMNSSLIKDMFFVTLVFTTIHARFIEKAINNKMVEYLDKYRLLSKTQYGFRKNMGTENALLNYIDFLQKELMINSMQFQFSLISVKHLM